ncbi:uncharacterized protein RBU33_003608 isoform 1-T1 [Hipposideros larvatus]
MAHRPDRISTWQEAPCSQGRNEARETGSAADPERKPSSTRKRREFGPSTEGPLGGRFDIEWTVVEEYERAKDMSRCKALTLRLPGSSGAHNAALPEYVHINFFLLLLSHPATCWQLSDKRILHKSFESPMSLSEIAITIIIGRDLRITEDLRGQACDTSGLTSLPTLACVLHVHKLTFLSLLCGPQHSENRTPVLSSQ